MPKVAQTATVWDESINGDLPYSNVYPWGITLDFALGINRIIGSSYFRTLPCCGSDLDPFVFTLPAGTKIRAITYEFDADFSPIPAGAVRYLTTDYDLYDWQDRLHPALRLRFGLVNETAGGIPVVNPFQLTGLDFASPKYALFHPGFGATNGVGNWTYQFDFLVTPDRPSAVPVPPTFFLMASGVTLFCLASISRYHKFSA